MTEIEFVVEKAIEGGFTARSLGASIFSEGDDMTELRENVHDAVDCHFDENEKPKLVKFVQN